MNRKGVEKLNVLAVHFDKRRLYSIEIRVIKFYVTADVIFKVANAV